MSQSIEKTADEVFKAVLSFVNKREGKSLHLLEGLERRVAELESRPTLEYVGTYTVGQSYKEGQAVTFDGSIWVARRATAQRPLEGNDWQLACKKGRDAR